MQYNIVFTKRGNSEVEMREREREHDKNTQGVPSFFCFCSRTFRFWHRSELNYII